MIKYFAKSIIFLYLFVNCAIADSHRFILFPLTDDKPAIINNWARYAIAELCFLKLYSIQGISVWDPRTIFQIDSSAYSMSNDSILERHQARWNWDIAIGGSVKIENDTLQLNSKVFWKSGKQQNLKMEIVLFDNADNMESLANALIFKVLSAVKIPVTKSDSAAIQRKHYSLPSAFKTCAQGLGFEMHGQNDAAVTAYHRAVEIDGDCAYAICNLSNLFDKNGNFDAAMQGFSRIPDCRYRDSYTIARAANFMVDKAIPSVAQKFIDNHKLTLDKTAEGMLAIGKGYLAHGEYQRAFASLTHALAAGPLDLEVQFTLGNAYLLAGEYRKAIDMFNELIKYHPDNLRYYSSLGAAFRNSGSLMESSIILESALKIDPENTMTLIDLAHTYYDLKWYQKARQLLQKAVDIDPGLDIAYVNLGVVYWFEGRRDEAEKSFTHAAAIPASRRASWNNIGNVFSIEGNNRRAIRAYSKADKSGKKNVIIQYNLAISYMKTGRYARAIEHFNELLRLAPDRIDILLQVASLTEKEGRFIDAESSYRRILDIYPYHREAITRFVNILDKNGHVNDAVKVVELYLENFPTDKDMMVLLCNIYYKMGWYEVAVMKYGFIIRDFPDAEDGYLGVAKCMYDMVMVKNAKNYDETIYALKQASEHSPSNPEPDLLAGDMYLQFKQYKELAVEHYERALKRTDNRKMQRKIIDKIDRAKRM